MSTTNESIISPGTNPRYIYLLSIDLLVFLVLSFLSYTSYKKIQLKSASDSEIKDLNQFKPTFLKGLLLANTLRALSLIVIITLGNPTSDNFYSYINFFAHHFPSFVFVSAYMNLSGFLAQIYYSFSSRRNNMMKPLISIVISCGYLTFLLLSLYSYIYKQFALFAYLSEVLVGLSYLAVSFFILNYGNKIKSLFEEPDDNPFERKSSNDVTKIKILTYSITSMFLLKSVLSFVSGFGLFGEVYPVSVGANLWDFIVFTVTEILPTVTFIFLVKRLSASQEEKLVDSDENISYT